MKSKNLTLVFALWIMSGLSCIYAQNATITAGGDASGSGGNISYSLGQINYIYISETNGSVEQGVQHPYELLISADFKAVKGICLEYSVFPNPTSHYLILKIETPDNINLICQLFDINGKLLLDKEITVNETQISMEMYVNSTYILKVIKNQQEVRTFTIIKK